MPARTLSAGKKALGKRTDSAISKKKSKKLSAEEQIIDPQQEQIDRLIREQEQLHSKLNTICSRIVENINIEDYSNEIDLSKQQPCEIPVENLLSMIDEICYFRGAFLNLVQETEDAQRCSIYERVTQLSVEEPKLVRNYLTVDQRLTFVTRERDLWKENAQFLQMMYATIGRTKRTHLYFMIYSIFYLVDQLEMGIFQKLNPNATEILRAHRLTIEDACRIFLSPSARPRRLTVSTYFCIISNLFSERTTNKANNS